MGAIEHFRDGYFCYKRDKYHAAISNYTRAIELRPDFYFAFYHRAIAKVALHDFIEGIADYTDALTIMPEDPNTLSARAVVWLRIGNITQAELDDQHSNRSNPLFYRNLGNDMLMAGNRTDALVAFDKGISILERMIETDLQWIQLVQSGAYFRPHEPEGEYFNIYLHRGKLRDAEGDFLGAIHDYERFIDSGQTWDRHISDYGSRELLEFMKTQRV